jgi:hypothetical protein
MPSWQRCPPAQITPQEPQLSTSTRTSAHAPSQHCDVTPSWDGQHVEPHTWAVGQQAPSMPGPTTRPSPTDTVPSGQHATALEVPRTTRGGGQQTLSAFGATPPDQRGRHVSFALGQQNGRTPGRAWHDRVRQQMCWRLAPRP